jgi:hypothetical protein
MSIPYMPEQNWHCSECIKSDMLTHNFCEDCEYGYHTIAGEVVDNCNCRKYTPRSETCDFCEDRKDLEHRSCEDCKGDYHADVTLEYLKKPYVVGVCNCERYKEYIHCDICDDNKELIHHNCKKCTGIYHINSKAAAGTQNIMGKCKCGLFNEARPVKNEDSDDDYGYGYAYGDDDDYDIEEYVNECRCNDICECKQYDTYQVYSGDRIFFRRRLRVCVDDDDDYGCDDDDDDDGCDSADESW